MTTYPDLLNKYASRSQIPYEEFLRTKEWLDKRKIIIERDNYKCQLCGKHPTMYISGLGEIWLREDHKTDSAFFKDGESFVEKEIKWIETFHEEADKPYYLHVHHKHYILTHLPWEYSDESLITYCNWCHWKFHEENKVDVYLDWESLKKLNTIELSNKVETLYLRILCLRQTVKTLLAT